MTAKRFRNWPIHLVQVLPPSVGDYVLENDLAVFVRDLVRNELEIDPIKDCYSGARAARHMIRR